MERMGEEIDQTIGLIQQEDACYLATKSILTLHFFLELQLFLISKLAFFVRSSLTKSIHRKLFISRGLHE